MPSTKATLGVPWPTTIGLVICVIVICSIQLWLPDSVTIGPTYLVPFIELAGIPIVASMVFLSSRQARFITWTMDFFLGLLVFASVMNATLLLLSLLNGLQESGEYLLFAGFGVLIINVMSFGLVYWWIDGGGPLAREPGESDKKRDFLFPQEGMDGEEDWRPTLLDYLFTAYTNIIAFSPTDTMPLTHRVKILFTVQSSTALLTIVVTLSRAINLIPGGLPPS